MQHDLKPRQHCSMARVVVPFVIRMPGTWINLPDRREAFEIELAVRLGSGSLSDAALALGGFLGTRQRAPRLRDSIAPGVRPAIEQAIKRERGIAEHDYSRGDEVRAEADARLLAQVYAAGRLPDSMTRRLPYTYARSFLYALDEFRRHLDALKRFKSIEAQVTSACVAFAAVVPDLAEVRHSVAHSDERAQLKGRGNKPLDLKSVDTPMVKGPGAALVMDSLEGNIYRATMADGHLGAVPVTPDTLNRSVAIFQSLLDSIPWLGSPRIEPHIDV
jgi:hypothetical protein